MAMSSTVQGPTPGSRASVVRASLPVDARVELERAVGQGRRPARPPCGAAARAWRAPRPARRRRRLRGPRRWARWVRPPSGSTTGSPKRSSEAAGQACRSSDGSPAGRARPGWRARARRRCGGSAARAPWRPTGASSASAPSALVDGVGIGVEVEQAPAAGDGELAGRGRRSSRSRQATWSARRGEGDDAGAGGEAQRAPVGAVADLLDAGDRAWRRGGRRGCPAAAAAGTAGAAPGRRRRGLRRGERPGPGPAARSGWSAKTSRTVSLNWRMLANPAAKATCGDGQRGGLDQDARGLGPLGPGEGERAGADLGERAGARAGGCCSRGGRPGRRRPPGRRRRRR